MLVELLQLAEATMIATTLTLGIVATGSAVVSGTAPPDLSAFITSVQPPYESDDKRIYPEKDEKKDEIPPDERNQYE